MEKTKYLIVANAMIEKEGKILLVQEKQPIAHGLWNTPGGKLDIGESVIEGAKREVREETGYDININGVLGVYVSNELHDSKLLVIKIVFRATVSEGELNFPKDELLDARWFNPSDALKMKDSELSFIRKEIEDFIKDKSYPIDIIRYVS